MEVDQPGRRRSVRREENRRRRQMELEQRRLNDQQQENPQPAQNEPVNNIEQQQEIEINRVPNPQNPILQQLQAQNGNIAPQKFAMKIPNVSVLRDFFTNQCKKYCPSARDMTTDFARKVLCGQKALLHLKDVLWVDEVPRYKEINTKTIWEQAKVKPNITKYFPDYNKNRLPQKQYLFNVINTVEPNTMYNYIKKIKKDRETVEIEDAPIVLTQEYQGFFNTFESISKNEKAQNLYGLRTKAELDKCCICFSVMKRRSKVALFKCNVHKGHKRCQIAYYQNRGNERYLCPFRCAQQNQNQ